METTSIKIIPFSGEQKDWNKWSRTFLVRSNMKGLKAVLTGDLVVTEESEEDTIEMAEEREETMKLNDRAYGELMMSCQTDACFGIVDNAISSKHPDGDAYLAWKDLKAKFEPNTKTALVATKLEFSKCKLESAATDPDEWIKHLETLRRRLEVMGNKMEDIDVIIHIINNLPKDYETMIEAMDSELDSNSMTMDRLKERIRAKYRRMQNNEVTTEEKALVTTQYKGNKKFKGTCYNCGKYGHKGSECRSRDAKKGDEKDGEKKKFEGNCHYCKKPGHRMEDCFKKKAADKKKGETAQATVTTSAEVVLMSTGNIKIDKDVWLGDSAATSHMVNSTEGMYEMKDSNVKVTIGDGKCMTATKTGKLKLCVEQKNGIKKTVVLSNVNYIPGLWHNLFSLSAAIKQGCELTSKGLELTLKKESFEIVFDRITHTGNGFLMGIKMSPVQELAAMASMPEGKSVNIVTLHKCLGHPGEAVTKATAKYMDWHLQGQLEKCEDCALGKAKQKNIAKVSQNKSKIKGERLLMDISSVKNKSFGGSKFWLLIEDENTSMKWSYFLNKKSDLATKVVSFVKAMKQKDPESPKFLRCDNAGENKTCEQKCNEEQLGIKFEFTAPNTPQQNGKVERSFATLYGRVRAMMNNAGFHAEYRSGLWTECAATATKLSNLLTGSDGHSAYYRFHGEHPKFVRDLKVFGEVCIRSDREQMIGKLENKGTVCVFIGYPDNHASDCFRLLNTKTNKIVMSRDVTWLNKTYGEFKKIVGVKIEADEDEEEETETVEPDPAEEPPGETAPSNTRLINELKRLNVSYNPEATQALENISAAIETTVEYGFVGAVTSDYDEPSTFEEAWNSDISEDRNGWREAITKEFNDMTKREVWTKVKKSKIPKERRLIGAKWVFKKKRNGVYRARLVALGYSQIPGIDFSENFAPVVNDVTFRILMIMIVVLRLDAISVDVETAFLHGILEEEIYMKCPPGMNNKKAYSHEDIEEDDCLKLTKSIYGLVQAARQWWKKFTMEMKRFGFKTNAIDPCLLFRENHNGICIIALYVDDSIVAGHKSAIDQTIEEMKSVFSIKVQGTLDDYLGCDIKFDENRNKIWIGQPSIVDGLEKRFGKYLPTKTYKTPSTPGWLAVKPGDDDNKLGEIEQREYRGGVGMLLHLVKHSRPDIANATREMSKLMDCATEGQMKELSRVIKFVIDTKWKGLSISPNFNSENIWNLKGYSDSDYCADKETRRSVTGFIIYLLGVPVSWKSKGQRGVTLSTTEAEYVALSEAVREIKFITQVLESMNLQVGYPITVHVDNIGAIFLANNKTTSDRTKHVDIRHHFVREYIEDGTVKIVFVMSSQNDADIFTKNLPGEAYEKHAGKFLKDKTDK